jgi:hypothetical protein
MEHAGSTDNACDSYSEDTRFESRPRHRLYILTQVSNGFP